MGWERPNVFAPAGTALASTAPVLDYSWGVPRWLAWSAAEQRTARRDVALFDQTSFSKYLLTGPDSERALQWLCTADVAVPPGRTVYTGMLNENGRYESDLTVTRLGRGTRSGQARADALGRRARASGRGGGRPADLGGLG